jgi:23S rRNA pseudouridine1911/1915/1917 synthase
MQIDLVVPKEARGQRLDVWLATAVEGTTRSQIQKLFAEKLVACTGGASRAGYALQGGESVSLEVPEAEPADAAPEDIPLSVLYEDDDMVAIDKPAGMVVHPSIGHLRGTLVNALLGRYGTHLPSGEGFRPGIVHRLDADTSGVIVVARHEAALRALQAQFQERTVQKRYLALVAGTPRADLLRCDAWLGRSATDFRKRAVRKPGEADAKEADTSFLVHVRKTGYSVVEARPRTGRTHQIRVHAAHLGHAILADALYGRSATWPLVPKPGDTVLSRQGLHAWTLDLTSPAGKPLHLVAPPPADLLPFLPAGLKPKPR